MKIAMKSLILGLLIMIFACVNQKHSQNSDEKASICEKVIITGGGIRDTGLVSIYGEVIDKITRLPIKKTKVSFSSDSEVFTDSLGKFKWDFIEVGKFKWDVVEEGENQLKISKENYNILTVKGISMSSGEFIDLRLELCKGNQIVEIEKPETLK